MCLFIKRLLAVFMALVCVLLMENILMGELSILGGMLLLSSSSIFTLWLFRTSIQKPTRRRRHAVRQRSPQLQVVPGSHSPGGPKAA